MSTYIQKLVSSVVDPMSFDDICIKTALPIITNDYTFEQAHSDLFRMAMRLDMLERRVGNLENPKPLAQRKR
jgi:hypothetical protein